MRKAKSTLPAMLVIPLNRGYLCYVIVFCYVVLALMSAFCKDCRSVVHLRSKRGTSNFNCGKTCEMCAGLNGCSRCRRGWYLHIALNQGIERGYCVLSCPDNHHGVSSRNGNRCKPCGANCAKCDAVSQCTRCKTGFHINSGLCVPNSELSTPHPSSVPRATGKVRQCPSSCASCFGSWTGFECQQKRQRCKKRRKCWHGTQIRHLLQPAKPKCERRKCARCEKQSFKKYFRRKAACVKFYRPDPDGNRSRRKERQSRTNSRGPNVRPTS